MKNPFISNLKKTACASKWDVLDLATLRYWQKNLANFDPPMKIFHYQADVMNSFRNATIKLLIIKKVFSQAKRIYKKLILSGYFHIGLRCLKAYVSREIWNWHCLSLNADLCIHFYWLSNKLRQASHRKMIQSSALRLRLWRFKISTRSLLRPLLFY